MYSHHDRVKKLRWQSRRGMKELDVLFEAFFIKENGPLLEGAWPELEVFLEQEDDVLFDWISGRNLPADPVILNLINTLTNAAKRTYQTKGIS
jgi:antitoxin CptB